jgi:deoxyribonuclease V
LRTEHFRLHQQRLACKVKLEKLTRVVHYIAGVDVAMSHDRLVGCICTFTFPELKLAEHVCADAPDRVPYIPGFLSFREIPVILQCYNKLRCKPDLMLVDGQGIAHPRGLGFATHLGVLLKTPTIGCAKSHLFGDYQPPAIRKGSYAYVVSHTKRIGLVLRTRDGVNPLFVSPGHLVDIDDCREYVLASVGKYRIPDPLRYAHQFAGEMARKNR